MALRFREMFHDAMQGRNGYRFVRCVQACVPFGVLESGPHQGLAQWHVPNIWYVDSRLPNMKNIGRVHLDAAKTTAGHKGTAPMMLHLYMSD